MATDESARKSPRAVIVTVEGTPPMRNLTSRALAALLLLAVAGAGAAVPAGATTQDEPADLVALVERAAALTPEADPDPSLLEEAAATSRLGIAAVAPPMPPQTYNGEVRAAIGSWSGFSNGQIPLDRMCAPTWDSVERFRCDARESLTALNAAYRATFGVNLPITDSYRSYDEQVLLKQQKPSLAATPGTSIHGWGLAADLGGGINVFGSAQHNWMRANANRFGWYHPAWAQFYGSLPEPWHWEYAGAVASGDPAHARALGLELVRSQTWDSTLERQCLADLWRRTSGWDYKAVGPGDLRGLPQASMTALYGASWATSSAAARYLSNPQTQIEWGLQDITARYGSACNLIGDAARVLDPSVSATSVAQGTDVVLSGGVVGTVGWTLDVADARTGRVIHRSSGTASQETGLTVVWSTRNSRAELVGPGPYRLTLRGADSVTGLAIDPYSATVEVTGSQNPPVVAAVPLVGSLTYVPVTPARLLDTRTDALSLGPRSRTDLRVTGVGGVPADAKAVSLNVTAAHSSAVSYIRAWPAGRPMPASSVLNTDDRRSASGAGVVVGVGGEGKVSLYNNAGSTHLVVDVTGYYTTASGSGYGALATSHRVLDTRAGGGVPAPGAPRTVQVAGTGGVPTDASAVVVNVTSVQARGDGYVGVVPQGSMPTTSTVNHLPGTDVANRATVALNRGQLDVHAAGGTGHVVVDVVGWYGPRGTAVFTPVQPIRVADTRTTGGAIGAGEARTVPVAAAASLPQGAVAAAITMTATQQTAGTTFMTAFPSGSALPGTSDLNTGAGRDQGNLAVVTLGADGAVDFYNNAGATHLVVDLTGYFRKR